MDACTSDLSSDCDSSDDNIYTNAVARLKILRRKEKLGIKSKNKNDKKLGKILDSFSNPTSLVEDIEDDGFTGENRKSPGLIVINDEIKIDASPKSSATDCNTVEDLINLDDSDTEMKNLKEKNTFAKENIIASIVLDPDNNEDTFTSTNTSKYDLLESENYNLEVKILWRSHKIIRIDIQRYESFKKVFDHFANLEKVPLEQILLMRREKVIKPTDTPDSLGISVIDIIEGGVMDTEYADGKSGRNDDLDENSCRIKIQTSQKESVIVNLKKNQPFKFAILQCATQLNVPDSKIKLYIDGESIGINDTPDSLDLENEACIDMKVIS